LSDLIGYLDKNKIGYEIIICNNVEKHDYKLIESIKVNLTNTFYYEYSNFESEQLMTAAYDQAVGDVIFEFYNATNLLEIFKEMHEISNSSGIDFTFCSPKVNLLDKLISKVASYFLQTRIRTFLDWPRVSKRDSLSVWNSLNSKSKVLKLNTFLFNKKVNYFMSKSEFKIKTNSKRFVRISLRTLIYGSSSPLRLVTIIASLGSLMSFTATLIVLFLSLTRDVVTGWTTTNLLISSSTLFILLTLAVLSEYVNQIVNSTKSQSGVEVVFEISSNKKDFHGKTNVEKI
jgi:hypothetical protein